MQYNKPWEIHRKASDPWLLQKKSLLWKLSQFPVRGSQLSPSRIPPDAYSAPEVILCLPRSMTRAAEGHRHHRTAHPSHRWESWDPKWCLSVSGVSGVKGTWSGGTVSGVKGTWGWMCLWTGMSYLAGLIPGSILSFGASQVMLVVRTSPPIEETWEMRLQSLGWEDPLEEGMATQSSILAWRIPWTEEPGRLQSRASQRVGKDWSDSVTHS